jgi:DNA-directed RNA polymerase specialized sigma24 family protein
MLEELSKNHKVWLRIAYQICKDKDYANDLVQDMYLRLYNSEKQINDSYIYFVLRSIFLDEKRKQREFTIDYEIEIKEDEFTIEHICEIDLIDKVVEKQPTYKKTIVENAYEDGIMNFCRKSQISYSMVKKTQQQLKEQICQRKKQLGMM